MIFMAQDNKSTTLRRLSRGIARSAATVVIKSRSIKPFPSVGLAGVYPIVKICAIESYSQFQLYTNFTNRHEL